MHLPQVRESAHPDLQICCVEDTERYILSPCVKSHRTTGTTTLSFPPVKTASVRLAPVAAMTDFTSVVAQPSLLSPGQPPIRNQALANTRLSVTAVAKARLPSRLFPPLHNHFRRPNRRPTNEAAASPMPTHTTPLTMLTSLADTSHPYHGGSSVLRTPAKESHNGMAHPMRRKICETTTGPRWSRPST